MKEFQDDNICLVIVFNHRYDKNIEKLEKIYGERFNNVFFLTPFSNLSKSNVIPVYESSFNFEGYISQGFERFYKKSFKHYIFIADDLILNPNLNYKNILQYLNLGNDSAYIKKIIPFSDIFFQWPHVKRALYPFIKNYGVEYKNEIPNIDEANSLIERHGIKIDKFRFKNFFYNSDPNKVNKYSIRRLVNSMIYLIKSRRMSLPYPLVYAYSDFVVVPEHNIKQFIHICGVFAAMNLFVEVAIPTALCITCDKIVTEMDIPYKGTEIWESHLIEKLENNCEKKINNLYNNFRTDELYIHPIKLSKWEL